MKVIQPFGKQARSNPFRLSLCDLSADMTDAWLTEFFGVECIEILQGDLMETGADATVSPANSFGDMSGGVDKRIDDFFGGAAQEAITAQIRQQFYGELPVGMALIVPMPNHRVPFVIAAPTMRVPQDVAHSLNAYLAMRAILVAVQKHNTHIQTPIRTIAIPGLCTGVGRMPASVAARQMRAAYDNIIGEGWKDVAHPAMAPFAFGSVSIDWRNEK